MKREQGRRERNTRGQSLQTHAMCLVAVLFALSSPANETTSVQGAPTKLYEQQSNRNQAELVNPLKLTEQMKAWIRGVMPMRDSPRVRLRHLLNGLRDSKALGIEQIPGPTATAAQAFKNRKANCVAFAHLVVALAREAGLQAYFVWTTEVEEFKEDNFLKIAERHLAAAYGPAPSMTVLDFRGLTEADPRRFRVIPDRTAAAIFHSNRGVEELLAEQTKAALTWLEAAVQLDPDLAVAWLNLGVGLRHAGDVNAAKRAYRHALEINPNLPWARKNLAFLLQFHSGRN